MGREHPDYRNNIEQLNRLYPDRELLTMDEVMRITGFKSRNTVLRHMGTSFRNGRISKCALARYLCG